MRRLEYCCYHCDVNNIFVDVNIMLVMLSSWTTSSIFSVVAALRFGQGTFMTFLREDFRTEFKSEYIDNIKAAVIAFANTDGGTLYIGVEDDGNVCGVEDPDDVVLRVQNALRDAVRPDIMMFVHCTAEEWGGKTVVKIEVQRGTRRPYFLQGKGIRPEGVFVRQGPSTVPASYDAIRSMLRETGGISFEAQVAFEQGLTFEFASAYFQSKGIPFDETKRKTLGLINADGLFTNLALLLSDQCGHSIQVGIFQGKDKIVFIDRASFTGSLFKQLEDAYGYLRRFNRVHSFVGDELARVESTDFPAVAIREGILNAVVHRDYASSGPILISLFDDRLEILNQGGLLPNMTVEEVRKGVSEQRNKNLAAVFYRLRLIEAFGTGFSKMDAAYSGCEVKPQLSVTPNSFELILPNRNFVERHHENVSASGVPRSVTHKPTEQLGGARETKLTNHSRFDQVLALCRKQGKVSRQEVQLALGLSQSSAIQLLNRLLSSRQIVRVKDGRSVRYELPPLSVDQEV